MSTKKFQVYPALSFPKRSNLPLPKKMLQLDNNEAAVELGHPDTVNLSWI